MLGQFKLEASVADARSTIELIHRGRDVVELEARALVRLAEDLDDTFADAVRIILGLKMRVVVTGMGKSGHIARKIAATLAATGTPAIFVHPAEAAHGDLGMIVPGDVLLAISNSGNTAELRPIMAYARDLDCQIIAIASRADSEVMRAATVGLLLPDAPEACPVNLAPTTSTTLTLALGDALAMTVMAVRGISREALQTLHPGGSIGRRLASVAEFMRTGDALPLVAPDQPMREVLMTMTSKCLGIAGVVDANGRLVGAITDGDLRRHVDQLLTCRARDVMSVRPKTIALQSRATDAVVLLAESRITALFVVDDAAPGIPVGIVHIHDFTAAGIA
ncbi:MAG: hypothetical protein RIS94_320 [Pseudomonadota bacterium]|jgi:arabinose-5-phosphate isomerase